ncbi:hypothetical protein A5662_20390 [Mycobacteriaceae bacterium 1482268.1]|nr:hypothetical protein A5662_20390 [Mycobacteriaceae bacterium 1482268.1]
MIILVGGWFAAWRLGGWANPRAIHAVQDLGLLAFALFAMGSAGWAARKARGHRRRAWIFLAVGLAGWAISMGWWTYHQLFLGTEAPYQTWLLGLLLPIAGCLALLSFPVGYEAKSQVRLVLDGLIVEGSLFLVAWPFVLSRVYAQTKDNHVALSLSLAHAFANTVTFTVAVLVLARARTRRRLTLMLLTAGLAMMTVSGTALVGTIANRGDGELPIVGWAAAMVILGLAALSSLRAPSAGPAPPASLPAPMSLWLPYVPLIVAAVTISLGYRSALQTGPVLGVGVLVVMTVLVRQFVVLADNRRLLGMVADEALHDPLTGLANRTLFDDRLAHAVQIHRRDTRPVAVMSLDIDDFKLINDSMGHSAGDALLKEVARRLVGAVRTGDTVARLGGDEFAILIEGGNEDSHLVARRIVEAFNEPFELSGQQLLARPSVGLAVASPDDADVDAEVLLRQADAAMYAAKRLRSGGLQTFSAGMELTAGDERVSHNGRDAISARAGAVAVRLLGELRQAIDRLDLVTVYQPKFDLRSNEIVGAEALVRWPHRERGLLGPDQFLPLVRQHGLMRAVTERVLAQALDDAASWHDGGARIPVCINLFAASLGDVTLPDYIVRALADRGLNSDSLIIEITEDLLVEDIERARAVLTTLRAHGIRIALDDFGSGYSALRYLRELPIDEVKLDKDFIAPVLADPRAAAIVRAVINLAQELGVTTVAEGIENPETANALRELGCDVAQGYHYSPPITAAALCGQLTSDAQI